MKRYPIRIRREASFIEEVDAQIVARSKSEAERFAAELGEGADPLWPHVDRYNVHERTPTRYELIEIEHGT